MSVTIDLSKCPDWFNCEEPQEILYWRAGVDITLKGSQGINGSGVCFSSESAAHKARQAAIAKGGKIITDGVISMNREEISSAAKSQGYSGISVLDEFGELVEYWRI